MKTTRVLCSAYLLFVTLATGYAQTHRHVQAQIIDGSKTPEQIPDSTARRLLLRSLSVASNATHVELEIQMTKLANFGFSLDEQKIIKRELATFRAAYDDEIERYNKLVKVSSGMPYDINERLATLVENLRAELSQPLLDRLDEVAKTEKVRMKTTAITSRPSAEDVSAANTAIMGSFKPNYSAYQAAPTASAPGGSLEVSSTTTVDGSTGCYDSSGNQVACPNGCSHTENVDTSFTPSTTYDPFPATAADGTTINNLALALIDGTLLGLNNQGKLYIYGLAGC